jgi:hypothetical protein
MSLITKLVGCGEFVKRQTKESGYSHFEGTWEELEGMIEDRLTYSKERSCHPGYRDGVMLVDMNPYYFRSAIVSLDEKSKLTANYAPRREGEYPFIRISAKAKKQRAKHASVVLYRHDVLEENNERQTTAEWEVVCIKARYSDEEEPMCPMTMARNFLHLEGGTQGDFSAEDFAKSIVYWNNHCLSMGKPKWYRKIAEWIRNLINL